MTFCLNLIFNYNPVYADCSITFSTSGAINLDLSSNGTGMATSTLNAKTDCANGYAVSISGPNDNNLYLDGNYSNNNSDSYFSTSTGTIDNPTTILGDNNVWGYSIDPNTTISSNTFIGVTNTSVQIASSDTATGEDGDTIDVHYGAKASTNLAAGNYTFTNDGAIVYQMVALEPEIITLTLDSNGGVIPAGTAWEGSGDTATKKVKLGEEYGELPAPTKPDYTFLGWSMLPSEYQAVEYIESTGTQWIDTGVVPSNTTGVYAKLSSSIISTDLVYFGSKAGSNNRFWVGNVDSRIYYGWNANTYRQENIVADTINAIQMNYLNDRKSKFNDEIIKDFGSEQLNSNTRQIYVFAGNNDGSSSYKASMKLYSFKISDEANVIHNYIPSYRKNDGVIGLYDVVDGVFYTNKGSGTFNKGEDIEYTKDAEDLVEIISSTKVTKDEDHTIYAVWGHNPTVTFDANGGTVSPTTKTYAYNSNYSDLPTPTREGYTFLGWKSTTSEYVLPSGYQEVEYVASTGGQYIELPFGFDRTDTIEYDASINTSETNDKFMISPKSWNTNNNRFAMAGALNSQYGIGFGAQATSHTKLVPNTTNDGERHRWHYENSVFSISDLNLTYDGTSDTFGGTTENLRLFYGYNSATKGKVYRYTHWKNNVKVVDLVPSYRKSDNAIGLYDLVNGVFYTQRGSGNFTRGKDVQNDFITSSTQVIMGGNHTLYAIWAEIVNVSFNTNGGDPIADKSYAVGSKYADLPTPVKTGYVFKGWANTNDSSYLADECVSMEFLESTGTQYINTGVIPNDTMGVNVRLSSGNITSDLIYFGSRRPTSDTRFWIGNQNSRMYFGWNTITYAQSNISANVIYEATLNYLNDRKTTLDNETALNISTTLSSTNTYPIYVFAGNSGGSAILNSSIKLYEFRISEGSNITHDFVPAYRITDKVMGLYDVTAGGFYTNNGTGVFEGDISLVDADTVVTKNINHTLYALWEEE